MWIPRTLSSELQGLLDQFPVLVVVGPRQVGKTSVLRETFGERNYVGLDLPGHAELAETRPKDFLDRFPPPATYDEVQYAPSLFRYIKGAVDQRHGENGLFVLSGSQNYLLMQTVSESLAGRAAVVPFLGLSGAEWQGIRGEATWPEFLWRGSYPALWANPENPIPRDRWYQGYVATYLERDVRHLLKVINLRDFERFIRACAARTAQTLNMSDLARDVGIAPSTAREWISVLQTSGQILLLEPYYRSLGKRLVKSPKLYFSDTGLAAFLMGFGSVDALWQSAQVGALFENYVVSQWLRWRDWQEPSASLWYWRNAAGSEVDLVIERNGKLFAIECKVTQNPTKRDLRGPRSLSDFYGEDMIGRKFLACTTSVPFDVNQVTAMPGWTTWDLDLK